MDNQIQSLRDLKLSHDEWGHIFAGLAALVRVSGLTPLFSEEDMEELYEVSEEVRKGFRARNHTRDDKDVVKEVKRLMLTTGHAYLETKSEVE